MPVFGAMEPRKSLDLEYQSALEEKMMKSPGTKWLYVTLFFVVIASLIQLMLQLPHLPERVASHFGAQGEPDGFMSLAGYAAFMVGLLVGMPLFFAGLGMLLPKLPNSMINMPNKEYWLAEERRAESLRISEQFMVAVAVASQFFFMGLLQITYYANIQGKALPMFWFWLLTGAYLLVIALGCGYLFWRFRMPQLEHHTG